MQNGYHEFVSITLRFDPARAGDLEQAAAILRRGGTVGFPTETVYGLGANARNPGAVRRIFEAKGRPTTHPVIVHIDSARFLQHWVREVPEPAARLAERLIGIRERGLRIAKHPQGQ